MHVEKKEKAEKDNITKDESVVLAPPDGGYGWVISFLACFNLIFVLGIMFSIGTLLDTLVEVSFKEDTHGCHRNHISKMISVSVF